jgi:hypothetical protein
MGPGKSDSKEKATNKTFRRRKKGLELSACQCQPGLETEVRGSELYTWISRGDLQ